MLEYESAGDGTPVVLLHPFPFDHEVYRPQLSAAMCGELPARIIVPRLPGFGGAPWLPPDETVLRVERVALDVLDLVRHLGLDRTIVVGAGFGGYVALEVLAAQTSDQFRAGLVMSCKAKGDPADKRQDRARVADVALKQGSLAVAELIAEGSLAPSSSVAVRASAGEMVGRADPRALAAGSWGIHLRPDPALRLALIDAPISAIVGAQDPFCSVDDAADLVRRVPGGRLTVVENCGHAPPLEQPHAVTRGIVELLDIQ